MLTKTDVLATVNAMPESHFERVEGVALLQGPTKFERGLNIFTTCLLLAPLVAFTGALVVAGIMDTATWVDRKLEARKAKKAAEAALKQPLNG